TYRDAGALHVDEQAGDALGAPGLGVGAAEEHAPVGVVPERRPHLLAGHLEPVALEQRLRAQRGQVRAGAGLGEAEAPEVAGGEDARGEAPLLRLAAVGEDGRARDADAEVADDLGRPGAHHLLDVDDLLGDAGVAPAVRLGPRDADPARLGQLPLPGAQAPDALVRGEPGGVLGAQIVRDVLLEPATQLATEAIEILLCHRSPIARTDGLRRGFASEGASG